MTADQRDKFEIEIEGQGDQTILLLQGFGTNKDMWDKQKALLLKENYRIITLNFMTPLHTMIDDDSSLEIYGEKFAELLEDLQVKDCYFVGHSIGGMLGTMVQTRRPESFSKMVMIGASPRYLNDTGYNGGYEQSDLDQLFEYMNLNYLAWTDNYSSFASAGDTVQQSFILDFLKGMNPQVAQNLLRAILVTDCREDIKNIDIPTLILHPTNDPVVPQISAEYLNENIVNSKLQFLDCEGHFPILTHSEVIHDHLIEFFQ